MRPPAGEARGETSTTVGGRQWTPGDTRGTTGRDDTLGLPGPVEVQSGTTGFTGTVLGGSGPPRAVEVSPELLSRCPTSSTSLKRRTAPTRDTDGPPETSGAGLRPVVPVDPTQALRPRARRPHDGGSGTRDATDTAPTGAHGVVGKTGDTPPRQSPFVGRPGTRRASSGPSGRGVRHGSVGLVDVTAERQAQRVLRTSILDDRFYFLPSGPTSWEKPTDDDSPAEGKDPNKKTFRLPTTMSDHQLREQSSSSVPDHHPDGQRDGDPRSHTGTRTILDSNDERPTPEPPLT